MRATVSLAMTQSCDPTPAIDDCGVSFVADRISWDYDRTGGTCTATTYLTGPGAVRIVASAGSWAEIPAAWQPPASFRAACDKASQ